MSLAPNVILVLAGIFAIKQPRDALGETIRMLLLPFGLYAYLVSSTFRDFSMGVPGLNPVNYAIGLGGFTSSMKLVEMTFLRKSPKRDGAPASWRDVLSYLSDPRGIHWDVDSKPPRAAERRNVKNKKMFLSTTLWWLVQDLVIADLCQVVFEVVQPSIATAKGGSIFDPTLPVPHRYIVSSLLTITMGLEVYVAIDGGYQAFTLGSVGLFGGDPVDYPPIFDKPWAATSVRQLWTRYVGCPVSCFLY